MAGIGVRALDFIGSAVDQIPPWLCHGSALAAAITEYRKDCRRQELVALRSTLEISRLKNDV